MKKILSLITIITSTTVFSPASASEVDSKHPKITHAELGDRFLTQLLSLTDLMLSVNDESSLERAKEQINSIKQEIDTLAKMTSDIPTPTENEIQIVRSKAIKKRQNDQKAHAEQIQLHLKQLTPSVRASLVAEIKGLYAYIDTHQETFRPYLGGF